MSSSKPLIKRLPEMGSFYRRSITLAARRISHSVGPDSFGRSAVASLQRSPLGTSASSSYVHATGGSRSRVSSHGGVVVLRVERRLGTFRASSPRLDEHVMNLPELGDSITEGTVVQWCKSVGDEVTEDEVVAVVETDKVSVDVRSTHVGVVVKLFAAVDDVVEVGKPLCTVDGDEASVVKAKLEAAQREEDANAPPPEVKKPNIEDAYAGAFMAGADFVHPKKSRHEPLIKFLGKRSHLKKEEEALAQAQGAVRHRHSPGALDFSQVVGGAMFGRPTMSEEEMAAVDSGGAEIAPKLRYIDESRWAS